MHSLRQSPRSSKFFQNPFPFYRKLRNFGKVVKWEDYNIPVSCDYATVNNVLRDSRFVREPPEGFFVSTPEVLRPFYENESMSMLEREPPYHTKLKSMVFPFFTKKKLKSIESDIVNLSKYLLAEIDTDTFNLMDTFSRKLPVLVICRLLGVPEAMASQLRNWSNDMVAMYQARRNADIEKRAVSATISFTDYLNNLIDHKKNSSDDDLISYLLQRNTIEESLTQPEIVSTLILLLNAGHEASVHTISNGLKAMIESNFSLQDLIRNPKMLASEILRFSTPLHMFIRYSSVDIQMGEYSFKKKDRIGLLLAGANRDPSHFVTPETFNPFLQRKPNLSLGAGLHFCLGAHLARLELELAIPLIIQHFPKMKLAYPSKYEDNFHFYGLRELIIQI